MTVAKVFWTGNSQAIRLPKAFRLNSKTVRIEQQGNKLIIEPVIDGWDWLDELGIIDESWIRSVNEMKQQVVPQERNWGDLE